VYTDVHSFIEIHSVEFMEGTELNHDVVIMMI